MTRIRPKPTRKEAWSSSLPAPLPPWCYLNLDDTRVAIQIGKELTRCRILQITLAKGVPTER
jgi:hypothetical protein